MCWGGEKKQEQQAPPTPAPAPAPLVAPQPADVSPQQTADQRRNRISALKYGAMSTIKTTPQGATGAGPDLTTPSATGAKGKIGS